MPINVTASLYKQCIKSLNVLTPAILDVKRTFDQAIHLKPERKCKDKYAYDVTCQSV